MTHKQILTAVWGKAQAEERQYLRVYIGQVRDKLAPAAHLKAIHGHGYMLEVAA